MVMPTYIYIKRIRYAMPAKCRNEIHVGLKSEVLITNSHTPVYATPCLHLVIRT